MNKLDQIVTSRASCNTTMKLAKTMQPAKTVKWTCAALCLTALCVSGGSLSPVLLAQDAVELQVTLPDEGLAPVPDVAPSNTSLADGSTTGAGATGAGTLASSTTASAEVDSDLEIVDAVSETKAIETEARETQLPAKDDDIARDDAAQETAAQETVAQEAVAQKPAMAHTLSVEPRMRPLLPADSPAWITASPDFSSSIHRIPVGSLPTSNPEEAESALDEPLLAALYNYVDTQVIAQAGASERLTKELSVNYVRRNLIEDKAGYVAELSTGNGPMYQKWVMLSVTAEQREQLQAWHREALQRERLAPLGLGVVAALGFIGLSHMVLRRMYAAPKVGQLVSHKHAELPVLAMPAKKCCGSFGFGKFLLLVMAGLLMIGGVLVFKSNERKSNQRRSIEVEFKNSRGVSHGRVASTASTSSLPIQPARAD